MLAKQNSRILYRRQIWITQIDNKSDPGRHHGAGPDRTSPASRWLLTGDTCYSSEIALYAHDHRYPWLHGEWHLFVLAGRISRYGAILIFTRSFVCFEVSKPRADSKKAALELLYPY
jgi:hypothetical protein